ncbi:hypothetical protein MT349_07675 [Rathayibacter caricis]|uniref:hypothetical protein n=1 Tax=Rathayibacter caricis TaxID=110936 RepID=UPI001FB35291|nr:hypothetical protein [Rathayibacter caricis]MCJ1695658.1 hypothetical protein [Rathayibacter caricis]
MIARRTWPAAVVTAVLLLSGCSAADPSIDDATAQTLDDAVVAVAERASADDFAGALTELEALQAALAAALASGSVTPERAASIQAEADVVRGDLEAAIAAGEAPEPAPVETEEPVEETPVEETPVEEEPVEETPVEEAPVEETPAPVETEEEEPAPSPEETAPVEEEAPEPEESEPAEEAPANGNSGNGNSGTGNDGNNGNGGNGNGNGNGSGNG